MTKSAFPIIVLFRQDLRLRDNPALTYACQTGQPIIPLYILDDENPGKWKMGGASRWWLHHSLKSLNQSLQRKGSQLFFLREKPFKFISHLVKKHGVASIYWNRCYEPYAIRLEQKLHDLFPLSQSFNGTLLFEPWEILINKIDLSRFSLRFGRGVWKSNLLRILCLNLIG